MLIDTALPSMRLNRVPDFCRAAEEMGFNAVWTQETVHDPFLPCTLLAEHTRTLQFGTAIAVSFARSPTDMAYSAWDLAQASGGRFILGLGTQVKAHITRRFGMRWPDSPVAKLREQIAAVRALWSTWQDGTPLQFHGEYYQLDLMSPFFNPGPIDYPHIPVYIAGVNTGLARLAGESADGFHIHPFHTPAYLSEVIQPAIRSGAEDHGRKLSDVEISATVFAARSEREIKQARKQIAFYASTPSYRRVMTHHGWEEAGEELSRLAAQGEWDSLPEVITEDMLVCFLTAAGSRELGAALRQRYHGIVDRINLYIPFQPGEDDNGWRRLVADVRDA